MEIINEIYTLSEGVPSHKRTLDRLTYVIVELKSISMKF